MSSETLLRLDKFTKLFLVHFSGTPSEDPQDYLDRCHEVLQNMGIVETNGVDFPMFRMMGSAKRWWRDYMLTRPAGLPELTWDQFSQLFLEKYLPVTLREDYRKQFEHLQQGSMTVTQYETHLFYLAHHATILLLTESERVRRFIEELTYLIRLQMDKETGSDISYQAAVNVTRRIEMLLAQERGQSALQASHGASKSRGPIASHPDQLAYSAPPALISVPPIQSHQIGYPGRHGQFQCQQSQQLRASYTCGDLRHVARFCPRPQGNM
ncbi:uncharacterized protein [Nicotiana tomentosiformis]|uniref:uncharacterized protein n=1 Tax=Nicotiana tomentosiformis TaxID=4098 RepID=UPI00388C3775